MEYDYYKNMKEYKILMKPGMDFSLDRSARYYADLKNVNEYIVISVENVITKNESNRYIKKIDKAINYKPSTVESRDYEKTYKNKRRLI